MFTISVETHFQASHQLFLPDGSQETPHEHQWLVAADLSSERLNNIGIVMNFQKLKGLLDEIVAVFDNIALEKLEYFQKNNSSAENVAKYIYDRLEKRLPERVKLQHVKVVEEPGCSAKYGK